MKTIKRFFKLGHFFERSLRSHSAATSRSREPRWSQSPVAQMLLWLLSVLLMAGAAFYGAEYVVALYIADYMHNIVDLNNGNFLAFDPVVLNQLSVLGSYQAHPKGQAATVLAKAYIFIEYCVLLFTFVAGLLTLMALNKIYKSVRARYFSLEAAFLSALKNNELRMHYQPIVDMNTGVWLGAEALLRWTRNGVVVNPESFIPLIEKTWIMPLTTRWICQQVIDDHSRMIWACHDFYISINLSAQDVLDTTFADFMEQLLAQYNVPASRIVFEVTEGVILDKHEAMVQLNRLRAQGHRIALDDFGTGYSNLSYLDCLPLDILKVDRSFVAKKDEVVANTILSHLLDMALHLNLKVIVEGVETPEQVERLMILGAPIAQGWFYSKDLLVEDLVRGYFSLVHPTMSRVI